jgi:putative RNA 2'-phosphotransferase
MLGKGEGMEKRPSVRVSKLLSLMLRHRPEEFGVEVDGRGFADLEEVLRALKDQDSDIEMSDIECVVFDADKQRFEVSEGRIRARYGHSIPIDLGIDPAEPPEFLYKGVRPRDIEDRQYVHLSFDPDVAARLGRDRRGGSGAVIRVDALRAHANGIAFYDCGPTVLTEDVPPEYLVLEGGGGPSGASDERVSPSEAADQDPQEKYGRRRRFAPRK